MSRKEIPDPPPLYKKPRPKFIKQTRSYKLITPLFGGGVEPNQQDPVTPIRGTAVRGHLRFWWRATQGGRFGDNVGEMKKAEDALWGSASQASQVAVEISTSGKTKKMLMRNRDGAEISPGDPSSDYGYVAFPLEKDDELIEGIKFKLTLSYPNSAETEIADTLWAWETFGGIGARTRRGLGAIACTQIERNGEKETVTRPTASEVQKYIETGLKKHVAKGSFPDNLPHLPETMANVRISRQQNDVDTAWKLLIKKLKEFRQSRPPTKVPGRSYWPEPDAIRRIFRTSASSKHGTPISLTDKFPRAVFGLPIIFQFKDKDQGDPDQTSLQGKDHDRLASPLILRPFLCQDGAVGIALLLKTPQLPPGGLILKGAPGNPPVQSELQQDTVTQEADFSPLNGNKDVLQAFLDTIAPHVES